jgi:predicted secreted protein with PEFG-CTERM motif
LFACLAAYVLISGISQQHVEAQITQAGKPAKCNCVIFRLDDIQDSWLHSAQIKVMNLFITKNQSLSLGIIMNATGSNELIIQKIKEGQNKGLFDLDIHGWNHVNYAQLSEQEQKKTLDLAKSKMQTLFSTESDVFIPPYDTFNNSTLVAMADSGIKILSATSESANDNRFIWSPSVSSEPYSILQFPSVASFMIEGNNAWQKVSNSALLNLINIGITKRGYAVIELHPQNFVKTENGKFVDIIDDSQVSNLSTLIDSILIKKIRITTFENIVGTSPALASPALASPALASPALASPALASPALASPAPTSPALASPAPTSPALASPAPTSPAPAIPEFGQVASIVLMISIISIIIVSSKTRFLKL